MPTPCSSNTSNTPSNHVADTPSSTPTSHPTFTSIPYPPRYPLTLRQTHPHQPNRFNSTSALSNHANSLSLSVAAMPHNPIPSLSPILNHPTTPTHTRHTQPVVSGVLFCPNHQPHMYHQPPQPRKTANQDCLCCERRTTPLRGARSLRLCEKIGGGYNACRLY